MDFFSFESTMFDDTKSSEELYYSDCSFQYFWDSNPYPEEIIAKSLLNKARKTDLARDWYYAFLAYKLLGKKFSLIRNHSYFQWKNYSQRDLARDHIESCRKFTS